MFSRNAACHPLRKLSTWRQISLATWERPQDPSVYSQLEIDVSRIQNQAGEKLTITPFVIKAVAMTLAHFPEINVLIRRGRLYQREEVDVFVQVFVEEKGSADLSGVKIRNPHQKSLTTIAEELSAQAKKIREGKDPNMQQTKQSLKLLTPRLLKWSLKFLERLSYDWNINPSFLNAPQDPFGGAMVTNVGMFGLKTGWAPLVPFSRTPILLLLGAISDQPVVQNGAIVIKPILNIGVTIDHRIIDGYMGGKAAGYLKELLENPEQLL